MSEFTETMEAIGFLVAALANDQERAAFEGEALGSIAEGSVEDRTGFAVALCGMYETVNEKRKALADVAASIESVLVRVMPSKILHLPDGRTAERMGGRHTTWRHDDLLPALARNFAVDPNGEVDPVRLAGYAPAVQHYLGVAAKPAYFRKADLCARGIHPGDYSTSEPGRRTVKISAPASTEEAA